MKGCDGVTVTLFFYLQSNLNEFLASKGEE